MQYVQTNKLCLYKLSCRQFSLLFSLALLLACLHADALQFKTSISIDKLEGHGFILKGITFNSDSEKDALSRYVIEVQSILLPDNKRHFKHIVFICNQGVFSIQTVSCDEGELSFNDPLINADASPASFHLKGNDEFSLKIEGLHFAKGSASVEVNMTNQIWEVHVNTNNVHFSSLHPLHSLFAEYSLVGKADGDMSIYGNDSVIDRIKGKVVIQDLGFTNQESTVVGDAVGLKLTFESAHVDQSWENQFASTVFAGEFYLDPVFIDANDIPKDVYGNFEWAIDTNTIHLKPVHIEDQNTIYLKVATSIDLEGQKVVSPVQLIIEKAVFPAAYTTYIQPFILESNISDLVTSGSLRGEAQLDEANVTAANFQFNKVSFADQQQRFALSDLNGSIGWGERYLGSKYSIRFESADVYKLRLGETEFSFLNQGQSLNLMQETNVPILDGSLNIESFVMQYPGQQEQTISMDLSLTPISMMEVSSVLGWPEMQGNLAGYAPSVIYKQGNIDVQGALLIRAFEGTTTIHNLKAQDLFDITPKVHADIEIQDLDLGTVTETFSFGEITGKLSGYIKDLQFIDWQPAQFDAWLGTPENDKTRHRISQTAVDNLTQIGNGTSSIFSKSFLRFFDNFSYDRLGIGCQLKLSTCEMRGVSSSGQGFYIVKGAGVPRIDIIGYTEQVSWPVLIARLKRVVSTQDILIQ